MKVSRRKKLSGREKNRRYWLNQTQNIIVEIILVVWILFCLFISLVKFGTYGILLFGTTGKIPAQIVIVIQQLDQWLTQHIWRSN